MQLLHKVTGNNRELKSSAYRLQNCISLADLLSTVSMPAGKDNLIVAVEYRQLDGVQYLSKLRICRKPDLYWSAYCPACGEKTAAFCHHPAGRGLRCVECLDRLERTEREQNIKVVKKMTKGTAKRQGKKAA